jgi:FAD/FMN-containing dehydrogenase
MKRAAGGGLTAFELMSERTAAFSVKHGHDVRDPFAGEAPLPPWYLLIEVSSGHEAASARADLEVALGGCYEAGLLTHAVIAESLEQAHALWKVRHEVSDTQNHEGGSIKHDVSVPVARVPELIRRATAAAAAVVPGARVVPFGHLGDGNIHFNVSQPVGADKAAFLARYSEMNAAVHTIVTELGGSISAEHGIGRLKRHLLAEVKPPIELELMRRIKAAFDPNGIMNPDRVL